MRKASWTAILRQGYRRFPRHQVSFPSAIFPELSAKGKVVLLRNGARTGRQGSDFFVDSTKFDVLLTKDQKRYGLS